MRPSGRKSNDLREISIQTDVLMNAAGSCLIKFGNTHVLCTASVDERVPPFLKGKGKGWVTAEYGMLPASTNKRIEREAARGKQSGRTMEIQRLIGRSLRSAVDMEALGERQIIIDCDVIQADGGTRTASITGGYVAMHLAFDELCRQGILRDLPIKNQVAAISCGVYNGEAVVDLDYAEDSAAEVDSNFVMTDNSHLIEIQGTAESAPFSQKQLIAMLNLADDAIQKLIKIQREALGLS